MIRLSAGALGLLLVLSVQAPTAAGPTTGGITSDDVSYLGHVPFEVATATGIALHGHHMYLTSWKNISIYDISKPTSPRLISQTPLGFQFENEDVSITPDGDYLLFSESLPRSVLHVWDVSDPANPVEVAAVEGAGDHTSTCILRCRWVYGSDGSITDLRNPRRPRLVAAAGEPGNWHQLIGLQGGAHDVEEYRRGFIIVSSIRAPAPVVDVRNPRRPRVLGYIEHPAPRDFLFHSGAWPRRGRDRFVLMQGEQNFQPRCDSSTGPFMTFRRTGRYSFRLKDVFRVSNGVYADGSPVVNALGCSAHWFDPHPGFRNGGVVAIGYYEHGTRFLKVARGGRISEVGYFLPYGGSTSAAYWITRRIVYAIDYTRGIDILRFTGDLT